MELKNIKGMRDLFGEDLRKFQFLENQAKEIFTLYGFQELRTPLLEFSNLFIHGVGNDTDIVSKEMYCLEDRKGEALALRPEGTASVVRHVIQHHLMEQNKAVKYFYFGPMFRRERPQKGRFRQFFQIGVEYFGTPTPDADLELIIILQQFFQAIQLAAISFQINTIGCLQDYCRPAYKELLKQALNDQKVDLCEDCQRRLETNPLRVLDCKNPQCIVISQQLPKIHQHVCTECAEHFQQFCELLDQFKISYKINPKLVRGLDYYSQTVFEVYSENLGAQNAVGGGGRYNQLFQVYGNQPVPAVGFALGLDRLAMLIEPPLVEPPSFFVIGHDLEKILQLVYHCRMNQRSCLYDPNLSSMKSQLRQANKAQVKYVLILGEDEIQQQQITIKNMMNSDQITIDQQNFLPTDFH